MAKSRVGSRSPVGLVPAAAVGAGAGVVVGARGQQERWGGHRVLQGGRGAGSVPQSRGVLLGVWLHIVRGRCRASLQSFGVARGRNGFSGLRLRAVQTQRAGGGFAFEMQLGCTERCWGCPCTPAKAGCPPARSCPKAPLPLAVLPRVCVSMGPRRVPCPPMPGCAPALAGSSSTQKKQAETPVARSAGARSTSLLGCPTGLAETWQDRAGGAG